MKHIYIVLLLVGTNLISAQDTRLFENTWYLSKIVSNEVDYLPPINNEVSLINLNFNQQENTFTTNYCNYMSGAVIFGNNLTDFSLNIGAITLRICNSQSVNSYENLYINFFMGNKPSNNYSYAIEENGTEKILTINSVSNQKAIYSSKNLSTIDFEELDFNVFYEATTAVFKIELNNQNLKNVSVEVFDSLGKKLKRNSFDSNHTEIGTDNLSAGLYLIKIEIDGKVKVKKVIKS